MTDNEIIKALECCTKTEFISDCAKCEMFAFDCKDTLIENALDLINRQQCEIVKQKCIKQLLREDIKTAKSEAVKECLAKVKNYIKTHCNPYGKPDFDYDTSIKILNFIDNIVKEMVGENNG